MKPYYRKDGRWEIRKSYTTLDGKRKYISFYGRSAAEAMGKAAAGMEKCIPMEILKRSRSTGDMTVHDLFNEYMEYKRLVLKPSTRANYRIKYQQHILPTFENVRMYAVDHSMINEYIGKLLGMGLSANYVRAILILLKSVLQYGIRTYMLPVKTDLIISPRSDYVRRDVYNPEERKQLIQYLKTKGNDISVAVMLSLVLGLRVGEVCGLKWSDIDLDGKIIHIRNTVQRITLSEDDKKTMVICGTPKTQSSVRDIAIPTNLCKYIISYKQERSIFSDSYYVAGGRKTFLEPRVMQYKYKKLVQKAGIRYICYHSLRHTFATSCLEKGVSDVVVSKMLGHRTPSITRSIYMHSSLDLQRKEIELVDIPDEDVE